MKTNKKRKQYRIEKHASINYNIHFSCLYFLLFIPLIIHAHIHKQKTQQQKMEKKKRFHLKQSAPKKENKPKKMNTRNKSSTRNVQKKSFDFLFLFFRQCFLSHSAYDMVETKNK